MERRLGRSVAQVADRIGKAVDHAERMLAELGVDTEGSASAATDRARRALDAPDRAMSAGMRHLVEAAQSRRVWRTNSRTILTPHPDFAADLCHVRTGPVEWSVLDQLAHPDPLVVYPQPVPVPGTDYRLLGFQAYGTQESAGEWWVVSTENSGPQDRLTLLLFLESDEAGASMTVLDLPRSGRSRIREVLEATPGMIHGDAEMYRTLTGYTVHALLYLCCIERDESPQGLVRGGTHLPDTPKGRGSRKTARRGVPLLGLGYHLASDMNLTGPPTEASPAQEESEGEAGGRRLVRHRRRSHHRFQPCGPGREQIKLVPVRGYWTKGAEAASVPIRQVHSASP